jgi:hypothetical protein
MPWPLHKLLTGHECTTAQRLGWKSIKNGELLTLAAATPQVVMKRVVGVRRSTGVPPAGPVSRRGAFPSAPGPGGWETAAPCERSDLPAKMPALCVACAVNARPGSHVCSATVPTKPHALLQLTFDNRLSCI